MTSKNLTELTYVILVIILIMFVSWITNKLLECTDNPKYYEQRNRHRMYDPAIDNDDHYITTD